jgi:hypothetical protein
MYPARVLYSAFFFVLVMCLVYVAKPSAVFDDAGRPRPFGVGDNGTMVPLGVVTVVAAVLGMYLFSLVDLVYG